MRRSALVLGLCSLALFAAPLQAQSTLRPPISTAQLESATELLRLLDMDRVIKISMQSTFDAQVEAQPLMAPYKDVMLAWAEKIFTMEKVGPRFARVYAEAFTEAELRELVAFYRTPTGRKLAAQTPELMQAGSRIGAAVAEENMAELEEMIQARMRELQQRPPAPR